MKRTVSRTTGVFAVAVLVAVFGGVPTAVADDAKVTLCHATDSVSNPYVEKTVPKSSIFNSAIDPNGHGAHTGGIFDPNGGKKQLPWGDIIPVFSGYGGLNVAGGQAWLDRGCKKPRSPEPKAPSIMVQKFATLNLGDNGRVDAGDTISYSFEVTNDGNVALTNVAVTDDMAAVGAVTCLATTLAAPVDGVPDWTTCTAAQPYTLMQADIDVGRAITNHAVATGRPVGGGGPVKDTDDATVSLRAAPGISVVKTATLNDPNDNGRVDAGETIGYSFVVKNTGNVTLTGITVADPKLGSALVPCSPTALPPGATAACSTTGRYIVTQANIDSGTAITNVAEATGTPVGGGGPVTGTGDATVSLRAAPGISVVKTATLADGNANKLADAGETIGYSFVVKNTGNVTLTNVTVADPRLVSAVTCSPTTLAPGEKVTCAPAEAYTVTTSDVAQGKDIVNKATASGVAGLATVTATDMVETPTHKPTPQGGGGGGTQPVTTTSAGPATITLSATVENQFGGKARVSDFMLTATGIQLAPATAAHNSFTPLAVSGTTPISVSGFTDDAAITNAEVPAGTYALSVSALPQGYSKSAWACHGGAQNGADFTVGSGHTVSCSIIILDSAASVIPTVVTPVVVGEVVTVQPAKVPVKVVKGAVVTRATVVAPNKVTQLAFTGAETVPLGLSGLLALLLGAGLILVSRRRATD